ncbi:MAG: PKD domain-containing protein [Bacteroidia bacterium]
MKATFFSIAVFLLPTLSLKADGLKINLGNDNFTSSTELIFTPTSTVGFEKGLDQEYRKNAGNNVNYIYTIADAKHKLYVNYLQRPTTYLAIDLEVIIQESGTFFFSVEDRANNLTDFQFSLTDIATGKTIAITTDVLTDISFDARDVRRKKKFTLHMFPAIKIISSQVSCSASKNGKIAVQFNPGSEWLVTLKNASSEIVKSEKCTGEQNNFENLSAGVYYVEVSMNDVLISETITAISKSSKLQANFNLSNDTVYAGKKISTDNLCIGGDRWNWDFGDGNTVSGYDVTHAYTNPGSYAITLTTANTTGCISITEKTITVIPQSKSFVIKSLTTY